MHRSCVLVTLTLQDYGSEAPSVVTELRPNIAPNTGRKGSTYLHHTITRWDDFANHTFFLQADTHDPREFYPRVRDNYASSTNLGFAGNVCDCWHCEGPWNWTGSSRLDHHPTTTETVWFVMTIVVFRHFLK